MKTLVKHASDISALLAIIALFLLVVAQSSTTKEYFLIAKGPVSVRYMDNRPAKPGDKVIATMLIKRLVLCPTLVYETWKDEASGATIQIPDNAPFYSNPASITGDFVEFSVSLIIPEGVYDGVTIRKATLQGLENCIDKIAGAIPDIAIETSAN